QKDRHARNASLDTALDRHVTARTCHQHALRRPASPSLVHERPDRTAYFETGPKPSVTEADIAVVGAGAAGLYAALCAARDGARVVLVSAGPLAQTASYWAQGGLAAALAVDDSPELHLADTERAGREAVRRSAAEILVHEAPACVADLQSLGVRFDADRFGRLALGLEGGHSIRRIVHAGGSATGRRLVRQLSALAAADGRIAVLEGARARALWIERESGRCRGLECENAHTDAISARAVMLATGGAAALWGRTTNPPGSQGTGLLLAHAAGARLADLELLQFHPTAVIGVPGREGFLITEAIRGEGATLHDSRSGERFVDELLPRDEVSRAIQARLRETGARAVGLDMRSIDLALFPNVVAALRDAGLDPAREPVPVAPAAHYAMGGIAVDLHARASVPGLYGVGEVSCTGLHGANRLASNSLSECFVFARRAVACALSEPAPPPAAATAEIDALPETAGLPRAERATRAALWKDAGIERTAEGLTRLLDDAHPLARLIARCALAREESRGAHLRLDHPARDPALDHRHAVVSGEDDLCWETWE
ncbi:MAG TPA: FAD-dependent oxidoreductase, partial [Solirubrobacteraceae bacterium]|nr:FAD-dependent oxidoreductase [Solirubrobacteraceae bacterium]